MVRLTLENKNKTYYTENYFQLDRISCHLLENCIYLIAEIFQHAFRHLLLSIK